MKPLKEKMDSFIEEIAKYYDNLSIIMNCDGAIGVNEISNSHLSPNVIKTNKEYSIPSNFLDIHSISIHRAKIYAKYIVDEETHALINCILGKKPELFENTDVEAIINDALPKIVNGNDFSCVIFCPHIIHGELGEKIGADASIKIVNSPNLSQQIVFVGKNSVVWTRNLFFDQSNIPSDNTSLYRHFQSTYQKGTENDIEFVVGTVSECDIIDSEYVRVYNLTG